MLGELSVYVLATLNTYISNTNSILKSDTNLSNNTIGWIGKFVN